MNEISLEKDESVRVCHASLSSMMCFEIARNRRSEEKISTSVREALRVR